MIEFVARHQAAQLRLLAQVADDPLSESDEAALRRFLGRPAVWTLLADAARQEPSLVAGSGAAARLLRTELDL